MDFQEIELRIAALTGQQQEQAWRAAKSEARAKLTYAYCGHVSAIAGAVIGSAMALGLRAAMDADNAADNR